MKLQAPFRNAVVALVWAWMLVFVFLPNLLVIAASFLTRDDVHFVRLDWSLASYARLFDAVYAGVFVESLGIALATTLACLALGYPFAYALSRLPTRLKPLLVFLVILPFWTNSLVRTYAMKLLLATNGLVNQALLGLGLVDEPLRMLYTQGAVIAGLVYVLLPFMILPLYAVFEQLRTDLLEVSGDLGAGRWRTFRYVVLPLTMPGVVAGCLLVLIPAVGMFYVADVLGGARHLLIGNIIKNQFLDARDWPFGAAASIALTLAMALLLYAYYLSARMVRGRQGARHALA
jgi:spermidine/putrescine transport system permease protein